MTHAELLAALDYNPDTGVFTRRLRTSNRIAVGQIAGSPDRKGYLCIRVGGRTHKAHRLAWLYAHGEWPSAEIDHINGIKSDNRLANLRDVPKSVNQQNRKATRGYFKDRGTWRAQIRANGVTHRLGSFKSESEARHAYETAKANLHAPTLKARQL